jgi:hypothetical protein
MTRFWLQVADRDGVVWKTPFGAPMERDLIQAMTAAIVAKGVGVFRTEAQVRRAIEQGMTETVQALKRETVSVA